MTEEPTTADDEIDFTKPTPKDFMPEDLKFAKNLRKRNIQKGCCDGNDSTEDVTDSDVEEESPLVEKKNTLIKCLEKNKLICRKSISKENYVEKEGKLILF